jgi:hypothetical protein
LHRRDGDIFLLKLRLLSLYPFHKLSRVRKEKNLSVLALHSSLTLFLLLLSRAFPITGILHYKQTLGIWKISSLAALESRERKFSLLPLSVPDIPIY